MLYFDWTYLVFIVPTLLIALIASGLVKSTYAKYSRIRTARGVTAEAVVRRILDESGLHHVTVTRVHGELTDHYDPQNQTVALSDSVYGSTSVGAIGVAAHEAGHAIQHAEAYAPMTVRRALVPATRICSGLSLPLAFLGIFLEFTPLIYAGIILFAVTTLFELVTLPVELDASKRAMRVLKDFGYLDSDELGGVRKVLTSAAMTYLASLLVSVASLLRLVFLADRRDRRR